jgi:hypothetical protein
VQGIAGTAVEPTISEPDRWLLFSFLQRLRGGCSKVLITSRSEEEWLGVERVKISLNGLQGEERREYCERILGDLGITIAREDYCPRRQEFDKARGSPSLGTRWLIDFNTKASKACGYTERTGITVTKRSSNVFTVPTLQTSFSLVLDSVVSVARLPPPAYPFP